MFGPLYLGRVMLSVEVLCASDSHRHSSKYIHRVVQVSKFLKYYRFLHSRLFSFKELGEKKNLVNKCYSL